jgi:hypothetical protein
MNDPYLDFIAQRLRIVGQPLRLQLITKLKEGDATVRDLTEHLQAVQQNAPSISLSFIKPEFSRGESRARRSYIDSSTCIPSR